jgi:hypothetical protein
MQFLKGMERQVENAFDQQLSLTDPDARSMATGSRNHPDRPTEAIYIDGELDTVDTTNWYPKIMPKESRPAILRKLRVRRPA